MGLLGTMGKTLNPFNKSNPINKAVGKLPGARALPGMGKPSDGGGGIKGLIGKLKPPSSPMQSPMGGPMPNARPMPGMKMGIGPSAPPEPQAMMAPPDMNQIPMMPNQPMQQPDMNLQLPPMQMQGQGPIAPQGGMDPRQGMVQKLLAKVGQNRRSGY